MKTACILAALLCMSMLGRAQIESQQNGKIATRKSGCQSGLGICLNKASTSDQLHLIFRYRPAQSHCLLRISVAELKQNASENWKQLEGSVFFSLEEEFIWPDELIRELGIPLAWKRIAPGKYPMRFQNEFLEIDFSFE